MGRQVRGVVGSQVRGRGGETGEGVMGRQVRGRGGETGEGCGGETGEGAWWGDR